jgi:Zn-dependent metalloprotease
MKTLYLIVISIIFPIVILSQNLEKIGSRGEALRNNKNEIGFFKATTNVEVITNKNDFFGNVLIVGKDDMYKFAKNGNSENGKHYEVYHQYYAGVLVKNGVYVLHWENGKLESANGNYIRINKLNPKPTFTEKEALDIWCKYQKIPASEITRTKIELFAVDLNAADESKTESNVVLAYRIRLFSININNLLIGYIDAHTGKVCLTEPIAITSLFSEVKVEQNYSPMPLTSSLPPPATGTFATRYSDTQNAIAESRNNQFFLEDWSRTNGIITRNRNNLNAADTTGVTPFADNNNTWTTAEWDNTNKDNTALDIHWALQKIYDYYLNVHGRRGWDSLGQRTNAYVHSLIYDGYSLSKDNAAYYPDGEYLAFGDGESKFKPLGSVDVVAHEYAHGINDHTSGFSGGGINSSFNEGLSDIWAATIESYIAPQKNKWKIGEEVMLTKSCLRNLMTPSDPTADWPIAHTYGTSEYNSNSEAYYRSGVLSHWFYLLSEGGSGTNGLGNSYTVYGLGIETAARLVYFAQAKKYLNGTTTYPLMRTNMMNATDAFFGANSFQSLQVANAWYAVGVGTNPGQVTLSGPNVVCSSGSTFTANNPPAGSTIGWSVPQNLLEVYSGGSSATPFIRAKDTNVEGFGTVTINFTSNGIMTPGPAKTVWVGKFEPNAMELYFSNSQGGQGVFCSNSYGNVFELPDPSTYSGYYEYKLTNLAGTQVITQGYSYSGTGTLSDSGRTPGFYLFWVRGINDCGASDWYSTEVEYVDCSQLYLSLSPNPSSGETTATILNQSGADVVIPSEWELEVYSTNQLLQARNGKIKDKSYKFNTTAWKEGVYVVRAKVGDKILTGKIVVKH